MIVASNEGDGQMVMRRRDWALLAIAAADGEPLSPVQLQKSLFLLGQEMGDLVGQPYYQFSPYNYGPFDSSVYRDAAQLAEAGLVTVSRPAHLRYNEYRATPGGLALAGDLRQQASAAAVEYLHTIVDWARSLQFADLVQAIYAKYPDFRVNSVFSG
jgi:uncharacterized protein